MTTVDRLRLLKEGYEDGDGGFVAAQSSRKQVRPPDVCGNVVVPTKKTKKLVILPEDATLFLQLEKDFFDRIAEIQEAVICFQSDVNILEKYLESQHMSIDTKQSLSIKDSLDNPFKESRNQEIFAELNATAAHLNMDLIKLEQTKVSVLPGREKLFHSMVTSVRIKLRTVLEKYNNIQLIHQERTRERLLRQAYIAMPEATEDQLQDMVDSGKAETIFYDQTLNDQKQERARTALLLLQEQQRDLFYMEQSIQELYRLFIDVTYMISNDTTLKRIQDNLDRGVKPTLHSANIGLRKAEKEAKSRRQDQIIFWTGVAGVAIVSTAATLAPLLMFA